MIWLARKAFFGRVPFPAHARRHRQEISGDVRVPRSLRQGMGTRSHGRALPADRRHRSDPAARRALGRAQDRRPQARARQARLRRTDRRHPPRRGSHPRQGARVLAARRRRRMGRARPAAGILGPVQRLAAAGRASAHPSDPALDRGRHLGLHPARKHPDHPAVSGAGRQALPLARRCRHHLSGGIDRRHHRRDPRPSSTAPGCRNAPAARMDHETEDAFERLRVAGYL